MLFLGFAILFAAAINDILNSHRVISTTELAPFGFFVFLFSQAFVLSHRFSKAFSTVENQRVKLLQTNQAFRHEILAHKKARKELEMMRDRLEDLVADAPWIWNAPIAVSKMKSSNIAQPKKRCVKAKRAIARFSKIFWIHTSVEMNLIRGDGSRVPVEINARSIPAGAELPAGVQGMARDITERRQAQEERRRLAEQLVRARKMEALGLLAGGATHDLNNVLPAVRQPWITCSSRITYLIRTQVI